MKTEINLKKILLIALYILTPCFILLIWAATYNHSDKGHEKNQEIISASIERKNFLISLFSSNKSKEMEGLNDILKYDSISSSLTLAYEFVSALKDSQYKNDPDLLAFIDKAKKDLLQKNKKDNIENLLTELNEADSRNHAHIRDIYKKLSTITPSNSDYIEKLKHHTDRAEVQEVDAIIAKEKENILRKKRAAIDEINKKVKKQFTSDGSNWIFVYYLKKQLHDPESFEHIETRYKQYSDYVSVQMRFRATNGFGAKRIFMKSGNVSIQNETVEFLD